MVRCDIAPALHLGCLGYGLAFCREWAVVDAAAQAVELHKEPFNGIRPCAFLVGNQVHDGDLGAVLLERNAAYLVANMHRARKVIVANFFGHFAGE